MPSPDSARSPASFPHAEIVLCPDGPILLRGEHLVRDENGVEHRTTRPVTAICRCGHSGSKPWCDGTHKVTAVRSAPA